MSENNYSEAVSLVSERLDQASRVKQMRSSGWQFLDEKKLAYAVAFVEEGYSHVRAAKRLSINEDDAIQFQRNPLVIACIQDIQAQVKGVTFLNEAWVDSKIAEIFPMVMGEVDVPFIDPKTGDQMEGKRFMPEIAIRLLDLKTPKKDSGGLPPLSPLNALKMAALTDEELDKGIELVEKLQGVSE